MINQELFMNILKENGVEFFTGVPDSYLNGFCNYLQKEIPADKHVIAANEGNAIGIAAGYYFSTKTMPLVYMQNSGLGNVINPLASLTDEHVYKTPLILLIGWRGEPNSGDHAQHITQGRITTDLLDLLNIPCIIAADDDRVFARQVQPLLKKAKEERKAVAILGRKGVFAAEDKATIRDDSYPLTREEAIETILDVLPADTYYFASTGRATRELYFLRQARKENHHYDFLNLGAMGHVSSVALGVALANKGNLVVCLDGDASALMHMGSFSMACQMKPANFLHIILNNGAHESVGGQPSAGCKVDFSLIAAGSGYNTVGRPVTTKEELTRALNKLDLSSGPSFIDFRIRKGLKGALPPLQIDPDQLISDFMDQLAE